MMNRNIIVITTSVMKQTIMLYFPGECASIAVRRKALGDIEPGRAARDHVEQRRGDDRADTCAIT